MAESEPIPRPIESYKFLVTPGCSFSFWGALFRCFGTIFNVLISSLFLGLVFLAAPIIICIEIHRAIKKRKISYHTHPSKLKVAVVGAGWTGMQTILRLQEHGVTQIEGFERMNECGGCWHPSKRYYGQQLHSAMFLIILLLNIIIFSTVYQAITPT